MTLQDKNKNLAPALEKTTSGTYIVDLGTSLGNTTVSVSGTIDKVSVNQAPVSYTHLDVYKRQNLKSVYYFILL